MYVRLLSLFLVVLFVGGCACLRAGNGCKNQSQNLQTELAQVKKSLQEEQAKHKADVDMLNLELQKIKAGTLESTAQILEQANKIEGTVKMLNKTECKTN